MPSCFRDHWVLLSLALLTQGAQLYGNSTCLTLGLNPGRAKSQFESLANSDGLLTALDRQQMEAVAIWNRPKLARRNKEPVTFSL